MSLAESMKRENCYYPLEGNTKEEVLKNLVTLFCKSEHLGAVDEEEILKSILEREKLSSTGLENGVAIPHAKLGRFKKPVVIIAVSEHPVDFDAQDKKPVSVFFMVLGSAENPSDHVQVLSQIARLTKNDMLIKLIKAVKSRDELISLLF